MKRILFSFFIVLFIALPSGAKVFIPLVKNVPPGTNGGGNARASTRNCSYSPLAYYEENKLYIFYPNSTTSNVIITNDYTGSEVVNGVFEETTSIQIKTDSFDKTGLYLITINAYGNTWTGYLDFQETLYNEQTIKVGDGQSITLRIGESRQLVIDPAASDIKWFEDLNWIDNPVLVIDRNGLMTALRAGNSYVRIESDDYSIFDYHQVSVLNKGYISTGQRKLYPTDECEWRDMQYTLTDNGKFIAEGVYCGSGAQPSYLNYTVTDQCIFLRFDINYEDSSKMFYNQPFYLEIEDCNAPKYTIYLNNRAQVIESHNNMVRHAISRGTSISGQDKKDTDVYYYDGWTEVCLVKIPDNLIVQKNADVTKTYLSTLLDSKIYGSFQIEWGGEDVCRVTADEVQIDAALDELLKEDVIAAASHLYVNKGDYECYLMNNCPESMELIPLNSIVYRLNDAYNKSVMDSLAYVYDLTIPSDVYLPEDMSLLYTSKTTDVFELSRILFETGYFMYAYPEFVHSLSQITDVTQTSAEVEYEEYYNLSGQRVDSKSGVTIVVTRYSDGSIFIEKKLFQ